MWLKLNLFLRKYTPSLHMFLKQATSHWRTSGEHALPVPVSIGGDIFLLHPSFMTHDQCEPHVQSYLKSVLRQGDVVIDVGANFGFHTILASRLVGNTGRVMAFEPSPENLKLLRYHCGANFLRNVQVYPDAVGNVANSSVEFVLVDGGKHSSNSLTIAGEVPHISEQQKTVIQVPMTTIDETCRKTGVRPKLIKIDVEGAELFVLEGARQVIEQDRPIILIGVHPFWMANGQTLDDIIDFFNTYNYEIKHFDGHRVNKLEYGDYVATPLKV
jgi:FkbM family methyltransferase